MRKLIEGFKPGKHVSASGDTFEFSESDLQATAKAYNPELGEAPLVVGHPKNDAPAYGWVASLAFSESDKRLSFEPTQVDPAFAEIVNNGRYKKISLKFYPPDHAHNPVPGVYYLRHVAFLGAQPPAVKGLKNASFSGSDEGLIEFSDWADTQNATLWRRMRDFMIAQFGLEKADEVIPDYAVQDLTETAALERKPAMAYSEPDPQQEQAMKDLKQQQDELAASQAALKAAQEKLTADQATLATREASFAERETRISTAEKTAQRAAHDAFLDKLVKEGKVLPAQKAEKLEFMCSLSDDASIEFGEGDKKTKKSPLQAYKDDLTAAPKIVEFSEVGNRGTEGGDDAKNPQKIAERAIEFQETERKAGRIVSIDVAVTHVTKQAS